MPIATSFYTCPRQVERPNSKIRENAYARVIMSQICSIFSLKLDRSVVNSFERISTGGERKDRRRSFEIFLNFDEIFDRNIEFVSITCRSASIDRSTFQRKFHCYHGDADDNVEEEKSTFIRTQEVKTSVFSVEMTSTDDLHEEECRTQMKCDLLLEIEAQISADR